MATLPRRTALLALCLILAPSLAPAAAALPSDPCVYAESWGSLLHVGTNPSCLAPSQLDPLPVLPGMEPSCFEKELYDQDGATCCDEDPGSCCAVEDVSCVLACPPGDVACILGNVVRSLRKRVGQEAGGRGICLDAGQDDDGKPYANVDVTRACTQPPPS